MGKLNESVYVHSTCVRSSAPLFFVRCRGVRLRGASSSSKRGKGGSFGVWGSLVCGRCCLRAGVLVRGLVVDGAIVRVGAGPRVKGDVRRGLNGTGSAAAVNAISAIPLWVYVLSCMQQYGYYRTLP